MQQWKDITSKENHTTQKNDLQKKGGELIQVLVPDLDGKMESNQDTLVDMGVLKDGRKYWNSEILKFLAIWP